LLASVWKSANHVIKTAKTHTAITKNGRSQKEADILESKQAKVNIVARRKQAAFIAPSGEDIYLLMNYMVKKVTQ